MCSISICTRFTTISGPISNLPSVNAIFSLASRKRTIYLVFEPPLFEEVVFDRSRVTSVDWSSYPILTFPDAPTIEFELINRPDQPPMGVGEAASTPVPGALANAVFDATGVRLRTVPFLADRVKEALAG